MSGQPSDEGSARGRHERTPSRPRRLTLAVVPVLAVVSLLMLSMGRDPRALPNTLEGRPAPAFALRRLPAEELVRLADLRGHVVVVNFWASWCAACQREHDDLLALWRRYRERGVVILGIVYQDTESNAWVYQQTLGGDWPLLVDESSTTSLDFGVVGIPETFFIGRDGEVAHKHIGELTYETGADWIDRLVRRSGGSGVAGETP